MAPMVAKKKLVYKQGIRKGKQAFGGPDSQSTTQLASKLLSIAPELRNNIYEHVAADQKELVFYGSKLIHGDVNSFFDAVTANHPLSQTCRQIKTESLAICIRVGAGAAGKVVLVVPNLGLQEAATFAKLIKHDTLQNLRASVQDFVLVHRFDTDGETSIRRGIWQLEHSAHNYLPPAFAFDKDVRCDTEMFFQISQIGRYHSLRGNALTGKEYTSLRNCLRQESNTRSNHEVDMLIWAKRYSRSHPEPQALDFADKHKFWAIASLRRTIELANRRISQAKKLESAYSSIHHALMICGDAKMAGRLRNLLTLYGVDETKAASPRSVGKAEERFESAEDDGEEVDGFE